MKQQAQAEVRVTLRDGQVLEIRDDLICRAFRELNEDLRNYHRATREAIRILNHALPVLRFVATGGPKPVAQQATQCLDAVERLNKEHDEHEDQKPPHGVP